MPSVPQVPQWDVHRLPHAGGKSFLVTGGNAGIGYFVAEQLAVTGALVVLGSRDRAKAEGAITSISSRVPGARLKHLPLDLADLASLKASVDELGLDRLDAVVHNSRRGARPSTAPRNHGFYHELMLATNHLGHFALTHHLAPLLMATPGSRIVTTGSFAAKSERLDLDDLQSERDYQPKRAYARSKLAQMLFAVELDRRLRAAGSTTLSVVVHPGGALDSLTPSRPPFHVRTMRRAAASSAARSFRAGQGFCRMARCSGRARPERSRRPDVDPRTVRVARHAQDRTSLEPPRRHHDRGTSMGGQLRTDWQRPDVHRTDKVRWD